MTFLEALEKSSFWLPYGLGLAAAGLLPIKSSRAYRLVSLALALLWTWLVLASGGSSPGWWTLLTAFEALLLLVFGVILGWLEFRVHDGWWAVVGTSFLLYALLIFPLLGRFFEVVGFKSSVFGAPFPVILLTCGVLFFTVESRAAIAFAVPFIWALVGGPEDWRVPAELLSLQMSLLAGALFIMLPFEVRQGRDRRPAPGVAYRKTHQRRPWFGYGLWALILMTVLLFFLFPTTKPRQVPINLALLSALGVVLWLAFPAWESLWFRSAAWWMARAGGRLWLGIKRYAWSWGILLLAAAALWAFVLAKTGPSKPGSEPTKNQQSVQQAQRKDAAAVAPSKQGQGPRQPAAGTSQTKVPPTALSQSLEDRFNTGNWPLRFFIMALFLWVAFHAYRGRKRLVIGTFSGYGDEKLNKGIAAGLGTRLQSELARIADVYKVIDDASPSPRRPVIEVTPGVLEVGEILKDVSAITLGPLKIPVNFFIGLVGTIVSGPRLTGALHKVEDRFILTAEISGGGYAYNWRVDYNDLSEEERRSPGDAVQKLVEQLAFRVVTDLVSTGSPRWRAVRCYTDGLRSYREAQRQQRNKKFKLRDSERCFIRALNDDQQFTQCHFNLGVVYRHLGETGSAQAAFRRVLMEDPDNFEACYALAEALVNDEKYGEGFWFCEAAIGINPDDARAWDLEAFACRHYHQQLADDEAESKPGKVALPATDPSWKEVCETSEIAVALAWRALCRRTLTGMSTETAKATAFLCTRNLAVVLTRSDLFAESRKVFRQAAWLAPHDPELRLYEGRTLLWDHTVDDAEKVLEGVFADGMDIDDRGLLWSVLAQVQARSSGLAERRRREGVRLAHNRFLDTIAGVEGEQLEHLVELSLEPPMDRLPREGRSS